MAHELPKRLVQSLRRPFYLLDAESERPVADTLFRPDGGPIAAEIVRRWNAFEALAKLADEFGCTLDQYNRNGPHWTHKDGTQVFDVAVVLDRAGLIEEARTALAGAAAAGE